MKKTKILVKKLALSFFLLAMLAIAGSVFARENVTDWYIKNFDSKIIVNKDSSLNITETITADCGNCVDKHGIFRILPTSLNIAGEIVSMPVKLESITNEKGTPVKYKEIKNYSDKTVTWKIGDADIAVNGVNVFVIKYKIGNVIRFGDSNFDELYWNLHGNFWEIETDKFHASIVFPKEVTKENTNISLYAGTLGSKDGSLAKYSWSTPNVLEFDSAVTLPARHGITASITFPKNIFEVYQFNFWQLYAGYFFLLIPLLVLAVCFVLWKKYGDDPDIDKSIIAEYEAPENLSPIELGLLMKNGKSNSTFITAEVINLASKGLVSIKKVEDKILFITTTDYELSIKHNAELEQTLNDPQKLLVESMFKDQTTIKLSELKNKFYKDAKKIEEASVKLLKDKGLVAPTGLQIGRFLQGISAVGVWLAFVSFGNHVLLGVAVGISTLIIFSFSFIMPKRTSKGVEANWKAKGFKLFMETVDKDRAAFYEKENIFEKFLPYAIVFGMTKEWISRMREIYGDQYFEAHAPLWFSGNASAFNANDFADSMGDLSVAISSNVSAPSGSGGMGGAGGGGGGGGGGGW